MLVSRYSRKMRLTNQLLRSSCTRPPAKETFLDLSSKDLVALDLKLNQCPKLSTLLLKNNHLASTDGLDACTELWRLDLACNAVQCLDGLARFVALGMLDLSYNNVDWSELRKIRHMHIISLHMQGNPKLDKDPYYRYHLIDIFSDMWMLDGLIVTASERQKVDRFFRETVNSSHPVHHKLGEQLFTPTSLKNLVVRGVFGEKTTHMMTRFPLNAQHNRDIDLRRLLYLGYSLQQDMLSEAQFAQRLGLDVSPPPSIKMLLEIRAGAHAEQCNMLLLLLVVSMMYALPTALLEETLEVARLVQIGPVESYPFLGLPTRDRFEAASLLLAAVTIDRNAGKSGGVYAGMYLAMVQAVACVKKLLPKNKPGAPVRSREISRNVPAEAQCLLASEVVQLLCLVPSFYITADREPGVLNLLCAATQDSDIPDKIRSIMWTEKSDKIETAVIQHQIASLLMQEIKESTASFGSSKRRRAITRMDAFKLRPFSSPNYPLDTRGNQAVPWATKSATQSQTTNRRSMPRAPALGDHVLLSKERVGRVVALPDANVAVVQRLSGESSPTSWLTDEDNYLYINIHKLNWESQGYWRPTSRSAELPSRRTAWESHTHLFTQSQMMSSLKSSSSSATESVKPAKGHLEDPCPPPSSSPTGSTALLRHSQTEASSSTSSKLTLRVDIQSAANLETTESMAALSADDTTTDLITPSENIHTDSSQSAVESHPSRAITHEPIISEVPVQAAIVSSEEETTSRTDDIQARALSSMSAPARSFVFDVEQRLHPAIASELSQSLGIPVSKEGTSGQVMWMVGDRAEKNVPYAANHMMFRPTKLLARREAKSKVKPSVSPKTHWVDYTSSCSVTRSQSVKGSQSAGTDRPWTVIASTASLGLQAERAAVYPSRKQRRPDSERMRKQLGMVMDYSSFQKRGKSAPGGQSSTRKLGVVLGNHSRMSATRR